MDKKKSIESLQFFVTHLAEGAIVHKQQGMIFKSQGFTKLGQKLMCQRQKRPISEFGFLS